MRQELALPRSLPEEQGVSSFGILNYFKAISERKDIVLHSLMILCNGHVVAEKWWSPYKAELKHMMFSVSKSFTSAAVGLAVTEGLLSVEDRVVDFFSEHLPEVWGEHLPSMRVKHLLTMSTGQEKDTLYEMLYEHKEDWIAKFFSVPVTEQPGTHFLYNSGATYMLSAIVQKVSGHNMCDYLGPRLFQPLGIVDYIWDACPSGRSTGGWGLHLRTEDLAKFGQLYLQKGIWRGQQILAAEWIEEATSSHITKRHSQDSSNLTIAEKDFYGYGYQIWRGPYQSYRADGAFGQASIVIPDCNMVIAMTSGVGNVPQRSMDIIGEHLLSAIQSYIEPALTQKQLKQLSLLYAPPIQNNSSTIESGLSGKTFLLSVNDMKAQTLSFVFDTQKCAVTLQDDQGIHTIVCGKEEWIEGTISMCNGTPPNPLGSTLLPAPIAGSGTWIDETTFVMVWRYTETAYYDTVTCSFDQDCLRMIFAYCNQDTSSSSRSLEGVMLIGSK